MKTDCAMVILFVKQRGFGEIILFNHDLSQCSPYVNYLLIIVPIPNKVDCNNLASNTAVVYILTGRY